jgi:hypothetical protein
MALSYTTPGIHISGFSYPDYPESDDKPIAETDVHRDQAVMICGKNVGYTNFWA